MACCQVSAARAQLQADIGEQQACLVLRLSADPAGCCRYGAAQLFVLGLEHYL